MHCSRVIIIPLKSFNLLKNKNKQTKLLASKLICLSLSSPLSMAFAWITFKIFLDENKKGKNTNITTQKLYFFNLTLLLSPF